MLVTVQHLRSIPFAGRVGYCHVGARAWFKQRGLDWIDFTRNGLDSEVILAQDDELGRALVQYAEEVERGRQ